MLVVRKNEAVLCLADVNIRHSNVRIIQCSIIVLNYNKQHRK